MFWIFGILIFVVCWINYFRKSFEQTTFLGLVVEVTHTRNPQRFEIKELSAENATNKTFLLEDREVSIQQYFQQAYNIELKYRLVEFVR